MDSSWTDPQDYPNWSKFNLFLFQEKIIFFLFKKDRSKPGEYQNIRISSCTWMIIDCPLPRIRSLRIDGTLQFQEVDCSTLQSICLILCYSLLGFESSHICRQYQYHY